MRLTLPMLLAAAIGGCATSERPASRLDSPQGGESGNPRPAVTTEEAAPPRQPDWSDGLNLEEALEAALARNPRLDAIRFENDMARAQRITAGTYPYNPELSFEGQRAVPWFQPQDNAVKIGLSQTFEIAGQRGHRIAIADENIERARSSVSDAGRLLRSAVTEIFYQALAAQRRREVAVANVELARRLLEAAQARLQAKQIPEIEVNLVNIGYQRALGERERALQELTQTRARLAALLGEPDRTEFDVKGDLSTALVIVEKEKLTVFATEHRSDLTALRSQSKMAEERVRLARASSWPDPKVGLFFQRDVSRFPLNVGEGSDSDNIVGLEVAMPLPFWNRQRGPIAEAEVEQSRAGMEIKALSQEIRRDIELAVSRLERAKATLDLYEKELNRLSRQNVDDIERAYGAGQVSTLEVIRAQEDLNRTNLSYLEAQLELRVALAELEAAAGAKLSEVK